MRLEARDWAGFKRELFLFGLITLGAIVSTACQYYFGQTLQIRWRRWLTERYVAIWMAGGPPLPPALRRQHGRQHPPAHRE
jgi:putative ATP-binding cassette transporter